MSATDPVFISQRHEVETFERCFKNRLPLLIKGPTGCGKTQLVEYMANKLETSLVKVACNEDTNAADLLGRFVIQGGDTVWQDGPVTRAVRQGGILYLDEIAEAREDVVVALHPLTDQRREIYLDKINATVTAPPAFMVVASFNPGYQKGLKELKPSTRQRFVNLTMDYLSADQEEQLLVSLTGVPPKFAHALSRLAHQIREKEELSFKASLSTRLLVNTALLVRDGMNPRLAAHVCMAEPLSDDRSVCQALRDLIDLTL